MYDITQKYKRGDDTALEWARKNSGKPDCIKLLEQAPYRQLHNRVMFSLHCAGVVGDGSRESRMTTPLWEFCTDERYSHMMESMMGMVLKPYTIER